MLSPSKLVFTLTSARLALGLAVLVALLMCAVPLLGIQGPESALVLGVILPPMAAWVSARLCLVLRARGGASSTALLLEASTGFAALLCALPALVLWLDALRIRNCMPLSGFLFMILGPAFSVLLASLCGVLAGTVWTRPLAAISGALALPIGSIARALARFYATPAIFAYGHFFGVFTGTVYDEEVSLTEPFLWLRVATAVWIAGIALLLTNGIEPRTLRPSTHVARERRGGFLLAVTLCAAGATSEVFAVQLHHASSVPALVEMLGGRLTSRRCQLFFPRELLAGDRARLADECDFGVTRAERWLGVSHPAPVSVYLFRSSDEKQLWMGAAGTNIAKPWRSEVYISETGFPNPTLGHELVHAVARGIGQGPLRIAGKLAGLWPDPALIEGVAVAAAWQGSGGLTPHEWAHAMLQLDMMPRLSGIFGAGFLAQQKRLAYTLSGSLLRFVAERYGAQKVRRAYSSGDLAGSVGIPLDRLEAEWHAFLRAQPLAPRALSLARARFTGPSVFSAVCPHAVATLDDVLHADLGAGDDAHAEQTCARILDIDPEDEATRATRVGVLARLRADARARSELALLKDTPNARNPYAAVARQALADEAFRRGDRTTALALYDALLSEPVEDDMLRQLQVKALAQRGSDAQAKLFFELLVGEPGQRSDGATAVHLARELRAERSDGLPQYLEARQLYFQKRFARAAALLGEARRLGLPTRELRSEATRVEAISLYATGDLTGATARFQELRDDGVPAHRADAEDWLAHITWHARSVAH